MIMLLLPWHEGMLQVFRRLIFCGVWRNGDHHRNSEHKPLYQVEYRDREDTEDYVYQEAEELHLGKFTAKGIVAVYWPEIYRPL